MRTILGFAAGAIMLAGAVGCSGDKQSKQDDKAEQSAQASVSGLKAVAQLNPTEGNQTSGTITFTQESGGVRVTAHVTGLTPGKHGWHIHEKGDCTAPDATSAGGHYNPDSMPHAGPDAAQRHSGDMGNLVADSGGVAHMEYVDTVMRLQGPNAVVGRAVIIHAGEDDLTTQPTGNSGARVACGVIEAAQ